MIDKNTEITVKEAYEAMLEMLKQWWELSGSDDLTDILSGGEYLADGEPADPAFWEYWLQAVENVKKGNTNLFKELK